MQRVGRKTTLGASTALFSVCQRHVEHGYWQRRTFVVALLLPLPV